MYLWSKLSFLTLMVVLCSTVHLITNLLFYRTFDFRWHLFKLYRFELQIFTSKSMSCDDFYTM